MSSFRNIAAWEQPMPRINEEFLDTIFFIYPSEEEAQQPSGSKFGATGFFVSVKLVKNTDYTVVYAVTNAHVIEALRSNGSDATFLRFNTTDGKLEYGSIALNQWETHPDGDDIAICPIKVGENWKYKHITEDFLISKDIMEKYNMGTGDETITMGRYSGHSGVNANLPSARFGHIAMMPQEPVIQDTRNGYPQESFLVETHSVNGYSGSPVFVEIQPDGRNSPEPIPEKRGYLLGIDWGHFDFSGEVTTDPNTGRIKSPSGMMCVVPAWKLSELLHNKGVEMHRKKADKKISENLKKPGVSLDLNISKHQFEDTLKKVSRKTKKS